MTWFKVDDGFYSSDKVTLIPRPIRAVAIGTWTLCGTWSAEKELDGFVPSHQVEELGGTIDGAEALVVVKLWRKRRNGYQFINWEKYQFTRAQNEEHRESERKRKAAYRERQKSAGESEPVPSGHVRVPTHPSPIPSPSPDPVQEDDDSISSRGNHLRLIHSQDDSSTGGVDNLVARVVEVCADGGITLHPLAVHDVVAFIDERRGPRAKRIQVPERYYPRAIRDSWPEVSQFIHSKGLAS